MEIFNARTVICDTRNISQGKECLAREIIRGKDIVIHHGESNHRTVAQTLLQGNGKFETFIKVGIQRFLPENKQKRKEKRKWYYNFREQKKVQRACSKDPPA